MDKKNHVPQGYALITGASAGIGLEFAKVFAENGHDLILVARSEDKLEELADNLRKTYPVKVKVISKDLTQISDREGLLQAIAKEDIFVEVLVNNAGFGLSGAFSEQPANRQLEMIELNIGALTHLSRLFLPPMLERKQGFILNVASTAAFVPGPLMAIYYASKAYVLSFTSALACELEGQGITVSALCPGPTRSEFQKVAHLESSKLFEKNVMEAKEVAEFGYRELLKGKLIAIPGIKNKFLASTSAFAPQKLLAKTVKYLNGSRTS
jgi:short-subunit dehydrogenase